MRRREFTALAAAAAALVTGCGGSEDEPYAPSDVVTWNRVALDALRVSPPRPTVNSRALFMLHCAMYDAWAAYDAAAHGTLHGAQLRRPGSEHSAENKRAAIGYAAYALLLQLFPAVETASGMFTAQMRRLGLATDAAALASRDRTLPAGIGNLVAEAMLASRLDDGANQAGNYADAVSAVYPARYQPVNAADPAAANAAGGASFDPARWQPLRIPTGRRADPATGVPVIDPADPSSYADQRMLTPHWGAVRTFALSSGSQLRPPPPPLPGSAAPYTDTMGVTSTAEQAYARQLDEIVQTTAQLGDRQKTIAEYWADGPDSVTPPGHWNEFAADVAVKHRHGLDDDVKMFFALNGALLDSAIACWEAKRFHDFVRPVSAIRHRYAHTTLRGWAGPGLGMQTMPGAQWLPFQRVTFVTPPFPEFTSGHSTFSAAGAAVLAGFTGSSALYDGRTRVPWDRDGDGMPDLVGEFIARPGTLTIEPGLPREPVVLRWHTLQEAADEAGMSRRYGGIHFQDGDLHGRRMGQQIGRQALQRAQAYWTGAR